MTKHGAEARRAVTFTQHPMVSRKQSNSWLPLWLPPVCAILLQIGPVGAAESETPAERPATEQAWLVTETARAMTEMMTFAKDRGATEATVTVKETANGSVPFQLHASLGSAAVDVDFPADSFVWSSESFAKFGRQLLDSWKVPATVLATRPDLSLVEALTVPTSKVLITEARRVSEALTKRPLDPHAHESAALIYGAAALRERAGNFGDPRREICRAVAHLALARTLRKEPLSIVGEMAEAVVLTLAERQANALAQLAKFKTGTTPGLTAWDGALRIRNTGDWRPVLDKPTPLERFESFRARGLGVSGEFAAEWLKSQPAYESIEWPRTVAESGISVALGHQFVAGSIPGELTQLQSDWTEFFGGKLAPTEVIKALNEKPARSVIKPGTGPSAISVLGWGFWAANHQRHLCAAIENTNFFLRDMWSVPEYRSLQTFVWANFQGLTLFPLLKRGLAESGASVTDASEHVTKLCKESPELVTAAWWATSSRLGNHGRAALNLPPATDWFRPTLPFGTVFDIRHRYPTMQGGWKLSAEDWEKLRAMAPYSRTVIRGALWRSFGKTPTVEALEKAYELIKDYDPEALSAIAAKQEDQPAAYLQTMQKLCALHPKRYFGLGDYLLANNQPKQAIEAYQNGVDHDLDRIRVAQNARWLVNHYYDSGQREKALSIAQEGAEVYSQAGLETMAFLLEKMGKFTEAEDYFEKIEERYQSDGELESFYVRNRTKTPEYEKHAASAMATLFPDGPQKIALADLKGPPDDGVILRSRNAKTDELGLKIGDIFVAVDGFRIHSLPQYSFVRAMSTDPRIGFFVWNGTAYFEIKATLPTRRYGADIRTWKTP
jgi:tetratricopeptide (TPR) repeat protein